MRRAELASQRAVVCEVGATHGHNVSASLAHEGGADGGDRNWIVVGEGHARRDDFAVCEGQ